MNLIDPEEEFPGQFAGCDGWGPCGHDHTGADARAAAEATPDPKPTPWGFHDPGYFHADCRYAKKRAFETEVTALWGATTIKAQVEFRGGTYSPLYPYPCPDGEHFHLTSQAPDPRPKETTVTHDFRESLASHLSAVERRYQRPQVQPNDIQDVNVRWTEGEQGSDDYGDEYTRLPELQVAVTVRNRGTIYADPGWAIEALMRRALGMEMTW